MLGDVRKHNLLFNAKPSKNILTFPIHQQIYFRYKFCGSGKFYSCISAVHIASAREWDISYPQKEVFVYIWGIVEDGETKFLFVLASKLACMLIRRLTFQLHPSPTRCCYCCCYWTYCYRDWNLSWRGNDGSDRKRWSGSGEVRDWWVVREKK